MKNNRPFEVGQVRMINNGNPREQGQNYVILSVEGSGIDVLNLDTNKKDYWDIEAEDLHLDIVVM